LRLKTLEDLRQRFGDRPEVVRFILNLIAIVSYSVTTFMRRIPLSLAICNLVVGICFLVDFILHAFFLPYPSDKSPLAHFMSFRMIAESWSIPSLVLSGTGLVSFSSLNFLRAIPLYLNVVRLYYPGERDPETEGLTKIKDRQAYVVTWLAFLLAMLYLLASIMLTFEVHPVVLSSQPGSLTLYDSIYFMIVTLTTVGYGDISPESYPGVLLVIGIISYLLFYVASNVSVLLDVYEVTSKGKGRYIRKKSVKFVVVSGRPGFSEFNEFMGTFFDHPMNEKTEILVLSRGLSWSPTEMSRIKDDPKYGKRVTFLVGTPLIAVDRQRASIQYADSFFSMARTQNADEVQEDATNILRVISVRERFPDIPIYCSFLSKGLSDNIVKHIHSNRSQERMNLPVGDFSSHRDLIAALAVSNLRTPGSSTLITNLITSWK